MKYTKKIQIQVFSNFYQDLFLNRDKKEIIENFQFIAKRINKPLPGKIEKNNEKYGLQYIFHNFKDQFNW